MSDRPPSAPQLAAAPPHLREAARRADDGRAPGDAMIDAAPIGMGLVDRDLRFVRANAALAAIDGTTPERMIGRTLAEVVPELAPRLEPLYRRVLADGEPIVGREVRGRTAAAPHEDRHWRVDYFPVRNAPSGPPVAVGVLVIDVTEARRAQDALREAAARADAASRAKSQFLAVLSHELRTPLTPVLACVTALADDEAPPRLREALDVIRRNVELEARLIDDLLDVTRISRGKLPLAPEPADAHALIARAAEICRDDADRAGLDLRLDLAAGRPVVLADPARLQQIAWNLIKNAVKFSPAGGSVAVSTRDLEGADGRPRLVVEVADRGVGIGPEALPHIFDAFEQGGAAVTRRFGGLGLGLAISRSLAEAHGGTLSARSDGPGQGATFTLELPALADAPAPAAPPPAPAGRPGPPLRLLLVEDHDDTRRILALLLGRRGHRVREAASVAAALEAAAKEGPFDLVISDIGLPDGSGLDLLRRLRDAGDPAPGLALSGFGMEDDQQESRAAGFVAHLTKPVDFAALEAAIRRAAAGLDRPGAPA